MSDFLTNFSGKNYQATKEQLTQTAEQKTEPVPTTSNEAKPAKHSAARTTASKDSANKATEKATAATTTQLITTDSSYSRKQKQKRLLIGASIVGLLLVLGIVRYQLTHVKVPDFANQTLAEAQIWATKHKITLESTGKYSLAKTANTILKQQTKAGKKLKKGSQLQVTTSLGPDPEEPLKLPDFMTMTKEQAQKWLEEQQATNLTLVETYHETIEKNQPIKIEFAKAEVTADTYRRKDAAKVYYSKGQEVYKKDITVPDFTRKSRSEVESWAKTNDLAMTYEETTSNEIAEGNIIAQSIAKDEKIAKKTAMNVVVSLGKGYTIPDFSAYSLEEAPTAVDGVQVHAKGVYTADVAYGTLLSQSVAAGTILSSKDELKVNVQYSIGQPYLKDLRGELVEGELQKYFYDEFKAKGANISYTIRYVDSAKSKGTVVGMSTQGVYLPLEYTVTIDISLGNLVAVTPTETAEDVGEE